MYVLAAFVGVFTAAGLLATDVLAPNALTRFDQDLAARLAAGRTPVNDDRAHWGATLAATEVKIAVTALVALVAWLLWRRWQEPLYLASTLVVEATAFIVITLLVRRPRPDVPRLESSPVDSSFPSGHVAAATVYGAFVVVLCWHTRRRWLVTLAASALVTVVAVVAWSRMYQGMHFFSDVVAGISLGACSLVGCRIVLGRPARRVDDDPPGPEAPAAIGAEPRPDGGESSPDRVGTLRRLP